MSILRTTNLKDYLLVLIALNGQLHEKQLDNISCMPKYKYNALGELTRESKVDKTSSELGVLYRLKRPNGLNAVLEISQELYDHYLLITNNHKKRNDIPYLSRAIAQSKIVTLLSQNDCSINSITINYDNTKRTTKRKDTTTIPAPQPSELLNSKLQKAPLIKRGGLLQPIVNAFDKNYINKNMNGESFIYLTSIIFKRLAPEIEEQALIISRFTGVLLSPGGCYTVYQLESDQTWLTDSEKKFQKDLKNYLQGTYPMLLIQKFDLVKRRGTGIFFVENYEIEVYMWIGKRKKKRNRTPVVPYQVCDNCHLLPLDKEDSRVPLELLKTVDWETKLKRLIYTEEELANANINPEIKADAFIKDRGYSFEMLSCNLKKLYIIEEGSWTEKVNILCYSWQHMPLVKTLKRLKVSYTIIDGPKLMEAIGGITND